MKYKVLVIEFGIKNLEELKKNLDLDKKLFEFKYANSFLDIAEIIYLEKINLVILCDFRGKEKTSVYVRMIKTVFKDVNILIITNEKTINQKNKLYYLQKGACEYFFYDEYETIKEKIKENYYLFMKNTSDENWDYCTNKVLRILKDVYFHNDNLVEEIAARSGYSISSIYHHIKADTGKTLGCWIAEMRIKGGKELLLSTNYPLAYITNKVGYKSVQGFIKAFRKITGMTPGEYKRQNKKE